MAQPTIKLHYFPLRGRGETSRLVLHAANREFVDDRIQFADWSALKPKTPFGSLPYLEVGDEAFGQAQAIASYLARENNLYGSSNLDALKIEQIQGLREDLFVEELKVWKENDEAKKAEMTKNMNEVVYPKFLAYFERLIKDNQTKTNSKFTAGDKLSLADIIVFEGTETLRQKNSALLDQYPVVKEVNVLVASQESIKKYLDQRPVLSL
ncbi:glutathione s-transferase [Plakobranchus ocellatus]|uniref:Glutathione s-transferase n=1 Tax=Plakobranchus ocellatus TaxID=259542 RepID=A0AAV3ZG48_9GAST|nr:glutathione s-transferase [Plakobranchus ocellatus]